MYKYWKNLNYFLSKKEIRLHHSYDFLLNELDAWISGILNDSWARGARRAQAEGQIALVRYIHSQLSGLGANESMVTTSLSSFISENILSTISNHEK